MPVSADGGVSYGAPIAAFGLLRLPCGEGETVPALVLSFPWRITLGTLVTFAVAACFPTSDKARKAAAARELEIGPK